MVNIFSKWQSHPTAKLVRNNVLESAPEFKTSFNYNNQYFRSIHLSDLDVEKDREHEHAKLKKRHSFSEGTKIQKRKSIFGIIRKRTSSKSEAVLSDASRRHEICMDEEIMLEDINIPKQDKCESCSDHESDGYVDIFSNDKNFCVGEDGWIELASDEEESKGVFKSILKIINKR